MLDFERSRDWLDRAGLAPGLLDRLLPIGLRHGLAERRRRARLLVGSVLAGAGCYVVGAGILAARGQLRLASVCLLAGAGVASHLFFLHRGAPLRLLANTFVAVSVPLVSGVTLATGGQAPAFLFGAALIPPVAVLLAGPRAGMLWTGLTALLLSLAATLAGAGSEAQAVAGGAGPAHIWGVLLLMLATFAISSLYESTRRRAVAEAEAADERQRFLEQRLLELEKQRLAHELDRMGEMASGVAHDFNNVLTVAMGNAELIRTTTQEPNTRELAADIGSVAMRAAGLASQLLSFTGRLPLNIERLDLWEIARKTGERFRSPVRIALPHVPAVVLGDSVLLASAIASVVQNATEALDGASGPIAISGGWRRLRRGDLDRLTVGDDCEPGSYVFVRVADEGCGIDAPELERIFDPFYSTKFLGRGLGLSAFLGIARMHGGAVHIDSTPGRGTTVELWLPLAARPEGAPRA